MRDLLEGLENGALDKVDRGKGSLFKVLSIGHRDISAGNADQRGVQVVKGLAW